MLADDWSSGCLATAYAIEKLFCCNNGISFRESWRGIYQNLRTIKKNLLSSDWLKYLLKEKKSATEALHTKWPAKIHNSKQKDFLVLVSFFKTLKYKRHCMEFYEDSHSLKKKFGISEPSFAKANCDFKSSARNNNNDNK